MRQQLENTREDYRLVFDTDSGDQVLKDLQNRFFINQPTFVGDPYETAFREGQRAVVLFIQNMLADQSLVDQYLEGYEDNVE